MRDGVEASRPFADKRGVRVEVAMLRAVTAVVDRQRIRQVLDNLVNNAIEYHRAGGLVSVILRETSTSVEVELVFDRFFRGGKPREKQIPGTGPGLNIVGSIVAAHAGAVTLESEIGRGTTFRVALPRP